ncbi:MAG: hypothetical protein ISS45_07310 [Candidatus Omnitrophica bacterium]|nr:hypothetical protein [Candidatus Omnitrophota bacterium]
MKETINIPDEAIKYILFQRTEYVYLTKTLLYRFANKFIPFSLYKPIVRLDACLRKKIIRSFFNKDLEQEYESIRNYLPTKCNSILDIGCGVAGIDVFLSKHYFPKNIDFYLLDKTKVEKRIYYMFEEKGAFYNSLRTAQKLLLENGIKKENINLIEATDNSDIMIASKIDFAISLISWGFHYPVTTYLNRVWELLNDKGCIIIDIRKGTNGKKEIEDKFSEIKIVLDSKKYLRILAVK